mmetsp:Transcript_99771/g.285236  ORF Transcript_99771/g.285236 Transcript_99771/m.285236 type:complete len:121 (+) Transcript_99771:422-784(+)
MTHHLASSIHHPSSIAHHPSLTTYRSTHRPPTTHLLIRWCDGGKIRLIRRFILSHANLKILYGTYQIICSTSFTLEVTFPDLFVDYMNLLNIITFDMFGTIKYAKNSTFKFKKKNITYTS